MTATIQRTMQLALEHHRSGRLAEAADAYRQVILLQPDFVEAHYHLGAVLKNRGRMDEAITAYRQAIALNPGIPEVHYNLGNVLKDCGRLDEAIAAYRQAIALRPDWPEAYNNLGIVLNAGKRGEEAIAAYRQAIALRPDWPQAYNNLGIALNEAGQTEQAIAACRQAIALQPNYPDASYNLGNALKDAGQLDQAIAAYRRAIALQPNFPEACNNLGSALQNKGQPDEAIVVYRQAIALKANFPQAYNNLGGALLIAGKLDEAFSAYQQAIVLKPDYVEAHSNLVYMLHFHPDYDAAAIYAAHRDWARQHAEPLAGEIRPHPQDRSPDRRLRIGYVSPDFRLHPVSRFLLPILTHHDRENFHIVCYQSGARPTDEMTDRLRRQAAEWHSIAGLDDAQAAERIRSDGIDILVDLSLHMGANRMRVFARKPAPVQVTYLAYAGTSGLSTIDYRFSDSDLDPPGEEESRYSEKTIRLPQGYWCYQPPENSPPVSDPPALAPGAPGITFGCLNNFCKVSPPTLSAWKQILHRTPGSRLMLFSPPGSYQQRTMEVLEVEPDRVRFVGFEPLDHHLRRHGEFDIALDPFPYGGGTTTCDALWMGVAVVTLAGRTAVGRGGVSILNNIGLPELIAQSQEQYVQIAVGLANDLPRLAEIRRTLRDRMRRSPLMDAVGHTRAIESAYRQMWRDWCKGKS